MHTEMPDLTFLPLTVKAKEGPLDSLDSTPTRAHVPHLDDVLPFRRDTCLSQFRLATRSEKFRKMAVPCDPAKHKVQA